MEMKESPKVRGDILKVIEWLMEKYLYKLRDMYTENPEEEAKDLFVLLNDLERLVSKAKKSYVGGYTIFVYSVLLGVLEGLEEVNEDFYMYLKELRSTFEEIE